MERKKRREINVRVDEKELRESIFIFQMGRTRRYSEMSNEQIERYFVAAFRFTPEFVRTKKLIDACRESTRLTVRDYGVYINI